jgi:transglutaminase-like putative cysteine protease
MVKAATPPLVLVAMIAAAGLVLGRVYAGPLLTALVAGAGAGAVLVGVATRRLPSWLVAPLSVAALAAYATTAMWVAADRAGLTEPFGTLAADAARNGIPRLLTAMIPVEPTPDTVLVPVVAAWLAGLAGAELGLRWGRLLAGYGPPVLLYAGALYVVGPNADTARAPTAVIVAAAALGLAVTGRPADAGVPGRAIRARAVVGALAVVALVVGTVPLVAGRVDADPVDPRRYVQPPRVDSLDENPLIRISGWALNPDQHLFDVTATGDAPPRIRLAVLSDYDGVTWRVGATYRGAGRVLPAATAIAPTEPVRQRITVADLTGRLLPAVATPERVDGTRVAYDVDSGTLIRPDGLTPGLRYEVVSARERPDLNLLTAADVPSGDRVARVLTVGAVAPERLRTLADELAAEGGGGPYQRALAIEEHLAAHYRSVADAPSGHALPNLEFFLFGPANGGGRQGTSEQFAAAFAVLGRLIGLPTRVVVGFVGPAGGGPVTGADALAWPEVLFDGVGWVAFDPMPRPDTAPEPIEEPPRPEPEDSSPPPVEAPIPSLDPTPSAVAAPVVAPTDRGTAAGTVAAYVTGPVVAVLLALAVAVVLARRGLRRRRLATMSGAWLEVVDALRLAGRPAPGHLSATEVAAHAAAAAAPHPATAAPHPATAAPHPATAAPPAATAAPPAAAGVRRPLPPIDGLADAVNRSAFAPGGDAGHTRAAAAEAAAYTAGLRAAQPWWRRLLWTVHPGPLCWHRRR